MEQIRNIAIIAHVDHGKTTLVEEMIAQSKLYSRGRKSGEIVMDSHDLERERGITILAKNLSIPYDGYKINIIDTPGHADFGGEVERVLNMADGVLLLVDAFEGAMPQTRFVLQKALEMGKKPIVVVNKVDRENCRPYEVNDELFELFFSLDATEEQLEFKTLYGSAKEGWMAEEPVKGESLLPLLQAIVEEIPAPPRHEGSVQMLISSLEYSPYLGRVAVGRVHRGSLKSGAEVTLCKSDGSRVSSRVKELMTFEGLGKVKSEEVKSGDICAVVGIEGFDIGDTIADRENPEPLPTIAVDEPTISMLFTINDSPFFGQEGRYITSRHIKERLDRELEKNLALRVREGESADRFIVEGRGVMHLSVLIETMRREGFELQVGQPKVLEREIDGVRNEPIEELTIELPEPLSGRAIEMVTRRKGTLLNIENREERLTLLFEIPSRGLIGLRGNLMTATQGEAVLSHRFKEYQPFKGEIEGRNSGSLVSIERGVAIAYAIDKLQERGAFFVKPGEEIYEGQIVGENSRAEDLGINICRSKRFTNIRAAGADDKVVLTPPIKFTLEEALEYIEEDELVEVTPISIRLRKLTMNF